MRRILITAACSVLIAAASGVSAETITYTYDARGRVIQVTHSGGPINGVTTTYTHDKANNRKKVKTTGAP